MKRKFDFTTGWSKSLIYCLAILAVTSCAICLSVAQADIVMSLNKITTENDVYTNVSNKSSVKYAINYGQQQVGAPIDGVEFVNQNGSSYYTVFHGYNTPQQSYTSRNTAAVNNYTTTNTYSGSGIPELDNLLKNMIYNDKQPEKSDAALTFGNLEAGKTYTARVLARSWGTGNSERLHTFSIDTNADGVREEFYSNVTGSYVTGQQVSEDQPFSYNGDASYAGAYAVDFTFTAQSNTATIYLTRDGSTNNGWHNYGVMLIETSAEQVKPTTPTLYNGSFEADVTHLPNDGHNGHAYLNENNVGILSGWQFTNLTNDAMRAGLAWVGSPCQDFLGNQTPPDGGRQLAWVQSGSNVDARLYQNVYGFDPTDKDTVYRVSMDLGGRTATGNPVATVFIGKDQATEKAYINSKTVTKGQFKEYGAVFVPNSDVQAIAIRNMTEADTSLLVDNVQLKAYSLNTFFSDNFHVIANATGPNISGPSSNDEWDRFEGGLLGAMSYTISVTDNEQIQVGHNFAANDANECNGHCTNALFFATKTGRGQSHASPDYNFANVGAMTAVEEGGRMYELNFKVDPSFDNTENTSDWAAVLFGVTDSTTNSKRVANVNGGDGVGILFRKNGGIQIFDGTNGQAQQNFGEETFSLDENGWANVRVLYFVKDFDGTSPVEVSLYVNDELISSFQTGKGFNANYFQLESYGDRSDYVRSLVSDLSLRSSAELNYDVSRIQDLNREWTPNGNDKRDIFFTSPRGEETTATHSGALSMSADTEINVGEGLTLDQKGPLTTSDNVNITKTGAGTLRFSGSEMQFNGDILIYEGTLDFDINSTLTVTNGISGFGNLIKSGNGFLTLTGIANYTGSTIVKGGTLSTQMLSTDSVEIQSGATLAVNELGDFSASVNVAGGTFDVGNTRDRTALFLTNLTVTNDEAVNPVNPNPGMITFDMNDLSAGDSGYDWVMTSGSISLDNCYVNLRFNNGDELAWWQNAQYDGQNPSGYMIMSSIEGVLVDYDTTQVAVDGVPSDSWQLDWYGLNIYLKPTEVSPSGSKYYMANLESDISADIWTIDGSKKLGAQLVTGYDSFVTYGKSVVMSENGGTIEVASGYYLTLSGEGINNPSDALTGSAPLEKLGDGTLTISAANTNFTGATKISAGTLALTGQNAIAKSASVENNAAITMSAAQTLNNLSGFGTIDNGGYDLTLNNTTATEVLGVISGAGALVKTGDATLTLSAANTYTGETTINAGTLKVVATGTLGTGAITNNAILEFALGEGESMKIGYTIANNGSGKTVKTGAGNLSLTSTTTGKVEIQEGTITLTNQLGNTGKRFSQVTIGPGASLLGAAKDSIGHGDNPTMIINVYGTFDSTVENETFINTQLHMYGGTAKASSGSTFDLYNNTAKVYSHALQGATAEDPTISTISAVCLVRNNATIDITTDANSQLSITNVIRSENANGKVVKLGQGTLFLNAENTFQGGFDINEGVVISQGGNTSPSNLGTGPITIASGATLDLREANQFGYGAGSPPDVTIRGTLIPQNYTHIKNMTLESGLIEKENGYTDGGTGLDFATRTGVITSTGNSTIKSRIHINSGATATFNVKSDTLTVDGVIKSDGGFTKTGAGTMKLTAANAYTGATTVSQGTLHLTSTGSLAASSVTVAAGATFIDASPSIASAVTLDGGVLTLGDSNSKAEISIGDFAVTGGTINFDFYSTDFDTLTTGAAALTSGTINLTFNSDNYQTWWNAGADGYALINSSALTVDLDSFQVTVNSTESSDWSLDKVDNTLLLKKKGSDPTPPDPPTPPTQEYYDVNSNDISDTKWTIDGSDKKGVEFKNCEKNEETYNGDVEMDGPGYFDIEKEKNLTIAGPISGDDNGTITKTGEGKLTLSGNNSYSGNTTVEQGTLALTGDAIKPNSSIEIEDDGTLEYYVPSGREGIAFSAENNDKSVTGSKAIKTGKGALAILSTDGLFAPDNLTVKEGELDFQGTFNGDIEVKPGATLSAGNSPGDLTVYGNVTIDAGATGLFEFSAYDADQLIFDKITIPDVDNAFTLEPGSTIKLSFLNGDASAWALDDEMMYPLVLDEGFVSGQDDLNKYLEPQYRGMFELLVMPDGLYLHGLGVIPDPGTGVPEPSTWALMLLGAMGLLYYRKRNK